MSTLERARAVLVAAVCCVISLTGCSRAAPTAARWKVHIFPASESSRELSINIAAPGVGYAYFGRAVDDGFVVEVTKADTVVFAATVSGQGPGAMYLVVVRNDSGAPAVITASEGLHLLRDGELVANNRLNLGGHARQVTLTAMRADP